MDDQQAAEINKRLDAIEETLKTLVSQTEETAKIATVFQEFGAMMDGNSGVQLLSPNS